MAHITDQAAIERVLREMRTVGVLGAHIEPARAACYVPDYLHEQGVRILGVNPALAGAERWGVRFAQGLAELTEPVDAVVVFRRSAAVPAHLPEFLALSPRPKTVWLQLGITAPIAAELDDVGIDLVQDRCTLADHRRFGIGRARP